MIRQHKSFWITQLLCLALRAGSPYVRDGNVRWSFLRAATHWGNVRCVTARFEEVFGGFADRTDGLQCNWLWLVPCSFRSQNFSSTVASSQASLLISQSAGCWSPTDSPGVRAATAQLGAAGRDPTAADGPCQWGANGDRSESTATGPATTQIFASKISEKLADDTALQSQCGNATNCAGATNRAVAKLDPTSAASHA